VTNRRRLLMFGLAAAVAYWGAYAYRMAVPGLYDRGGVFKGADYEHFYVLGHVALRHQPELLYDEQAQFAMGRELFGPRRDTGFGTPAYGPQMSVVFAPLARVPYITSLVAWWVVTAGIYLTGLWWLLREAPAVRSRAGAPVLWTLALAFPGFQAAITWGQITAIGLLCFLVATWALRAHRRWIFGFALGGLFYKPPLGLVAAVVLVARREWAAVCGALVSCLAQLAVGIWYYGDWHVVQEYAAALTRLARDAHAIEPVPEQMHSLRAFWILLLGRTQPALWLYAASAVALTAGVVRLWRPRQFHPLAWSALVVASVLVSPHVTIYDLIVLLPVFILVSDWTLTHADSVYVRPLSLLLSGIFVAPFLGASVTSLVRVQLSVVLMVGLVIVLARASADGTPARAADHVVG
jgi:hypothetical protein